MGVGVKGGLGGAQEMFVLSKSLFGSSQKKGLNPWDDICGIGSFVPCAAGRGSTLRSFTPTTLNPN